MTGFGIEDSHHSASAWRRGPGGMIYFQEGIFLHTQVETQYGMVYNYNGGVYQYNPRTQELNVFARIGVGNPWGHVFDKWGQSFLVDNPRVNYLSPSTGNSGQKINVNKLIQTEKQCGGDLVTGTHMPDELQGQLLTGRFKGRAVIRYEFVEDGAGFSAYVKEPLVSSRHPNFRPVDVKIGPDGAVYIADWYNSIINHANHNFRDPRRDHSHGRIWRVTAKDRPLVKKPKLVGESVDALLNHLKSPEAWVRHQAKFELGKADADEVLRKAESWVDQLSKTDPEYDHHLTEAMWACQNVERVSEKILNKVLNAENGRARAAGARVIRYWYDQLSDPVALIEKLCKDSFPRVRMEGILSAGFIPKAEAFPAMLHALDFESDKFLDTAFPQSVKALAPYWRPKLEAGTLSFAKPEHRSYAEKNAGLGFDKRLVEFSKMKKPSEVLKREMMTEFSRTAQLEQFKSAIEIINTKDTDPSVAATLLLGMFRSRVDAQTPLKSALFKLEPMLQNIHADLAIATADVLGKFKITQAIPGILEAMKDDTKPHDLRQSMAKALGTIRNSNSVSALRKMTKADDTYLKSLAAYGLIYADLDFAAQATADLFKEKSDQYDPISFIKTFVGINKGSRSLAEALKAVELHVDVIEKVESHHRQSGFLISI